MGFIISAEAFDYNAIKYLLNSDSIFALKLHEHIQRNLINDKKFEYSDFIKLGFLIS